MTLDQLRAEKAALEQKYPEAKEELVWREWRYYGLAAMVGVLSTVLSLVGLRVACEFVIVVFNIALSLTTIKERLGSVNIASAPAKITASSEG